MVRRGIALRRDAPRHRHEAPPPQQQRPRISSPSQSKPARLRGRGPQEAAKAAADETGKDPLDGKAVLVTDMGARDKIFGPSGLWPLESAEGRAVPALGRVCRIELATGKVSVAVDRSPIMPCPNGVDVLADGSLRVGDLFNGNLIEFRSGAKLSKAKAADGQTLGEKDATILGTGHRGADGVVHDEAGNIYLSEVFTGVVWRIRPGGEKQEIAHLTSAADHTVDPRPPSAPRLIVPDTKAGALVFIPLPTGR